MDDETIREIFVGLGGVSIRRMFGGKGIYFGGVIVAADLDGDLLLKGDEVSGPELEAAGSTRWVYTGRHGKPVAMPYWSIPESAMDDPDELAVWTRKAYEAALRSEVVKAAAKAGKGRRTRNPADRKRS